MKDCHIRLPEGFAGQSKGKAQVQKHKAKSTDAEDGGGPIRSS
jgi:hypothetical protein